MQIYQDVFPGSEYWRSCRKICMLTCSDYASAMNCVDAHKSRIHLYEVKMGLKEDKENEYSRHLYENGQHQEQLCIQWFECINDHRILYFRPGFWKDHSDDRLGGSPDGVLSVHGERFVVEIKSPDNWPPKLKWYPVIQLMGNMHAGEIYRGLLVYFSSMHGKPLMFLVEFNDEIWDMIMDGLIPFLECMETGTTPRSPCKKTMKKLDVTQYVTPINDVRELIPKKR
jgi:hypothetical protein